MIKPVALIDLDGTVADYDGALLRRLKEIKSPFEPDIDNPWEHAGTRWFEERRHLITSEPGWFLNLETIPMGMTVYGYLLDAGFNTMVLTKGPCGISQAWGEKYIWCRENLDASTEITVTTYKALTHGQILYDDWPPYFEPWLKNNPDGIVLYNQTPVTADYYHPRAYPVTPENLESVFKIINSVKEKHYDSASNS